MQNALSFLALNHASEDPLLTRYYKYSIFDLFVDKPCSIGRGTWSGISFAWLCKSFLAASPTLHMHIAHHDPLCDALFQLSFGLLTHQLSASVI